MLNGRVLTLVLLVTAFAFAADDAKKPGTVNFVKGAVFLQDALVRVDDSNPPVIEVTQRLRSDEGNAEIFSTEGSFMRLAANSEVELVATDGTAATVRLHSGSIIIDAFKIKKSSPLTVLVGDTEITIASKGEFRFDIAGDSSSALHVLKGKVKLAAAGGSQELKKKQVAEVTVAGVQVAKFKDFAEDPLTAWHEQRSETIGASVYTAPGYFGMGELPDASRSGISR